MRAVLVISLLVACLGPAAAHADDAASVTLSVSVASAHGGTVTSDPVGISCPGTCAMTVPAKTQIALTGSGARPGLDFGRWSGACTGTQPYCTFAIDGTTKVGATFRPTPGWGAHLKAKSITDPRQLYGPLKGFTYGPWLEAQQLSATTATTATNVNTGTRAYVLVVTCPQSSPFGPKAPTTTLVVRPCVVSSDTPLAIKLDGLRVFTYLSGRGTGVARPLVHNPAGFEIVVLSSDSRDALEIMKQLNRNVS